MFKSKGITVKTGDEELVNITSRVSEKLSETGIENGFCLVFCPHTTAGIFVNERESGLKEDMLSFLKETAPKGQGYKHDRGPETNAHAHIRNMLTGESTVLPVEDGKLVLGTWQNVFLLESDGPRTRNVNIYVMGEN